MHSSIIRRTSFSLAFTPPFGHLFDQLKPERAKPAEICPNPNPTFLPHHFSPCFIREASRVRDEREAMRIGSPFCLFDAHARASIKIYLLSSCSLRAVSRPLPSCGPVKPEGAANMPFAACLRSRTPSDCQKQSLQL